MPPTPTPIHVCLTACPPPPPVCLSACLSTFCLLSFQPAYPACPQPRISVSLTVCSPVCLSVRFLSSFLPACLPCLSPTTHFCQYDCLSSCLSDSVHFLSSFQHVFPVCPKPLFMIICLSKCLSSCLSICQSVRFFLLQPAYSACPLSRLSSHLPDCLHVICLSSRLLSLPVCPSSCITVCLSAFCLFLAYLSCLSPPMPFYRSVCVTTSPSAC